MQQKKYFLKNGDLSIKMNKNIKKEYSKNYFSKRRKTYLKKNNNTDMQPIRIFKKEYDK